MSDGGTLGIDPGMNSGAVVWLEADRKTVRMWWVWLKMKRKDGPAIRLKSLAGVVDCQSVGEAMEMVRQAVDSHLFFASRPCSLAAISIEGLFVGRRNGKLRVQDVLLVAESCGEIRHALRDLSPVIHRPTANVWRPEAAGIPARCQKDKAEAWAITYARALFTWPEHGQKLTKAEKGAIAEAAFIGKWAQDQGAMCIRRK